MHPIIELEQQYSPNLFKSMPMVLVRGEGAYVYDSEGKEYLDMVSAVSVTNFGHSHPVLLAALWQQAQKVSMLSRLYHSETLGAFLKKACELSGMDRAIPLNSGCEAIEAALKAARKWAYVVKQVPQDRAEIIVCEGNFHGRTITVVSASTESHYKDQFGPLTPGFKVIPFNDPEALAAAITPYTAAFLVEPVQGEGGVIVPDSGYLAACQAICAEKQVLMLCDEIQTGMGRTGRFLSCQHQGVTPDAVLLGKSLGGGLLPVSLFLGKEELMQVFTPGDHGSTFGGNPLAAAVGLAALELLDSEQLWQNAETMGAYFIEQLQQISHPALRQVRGQGLLLGIEINTDRVSTSDLSWQLICNGLLNINTRQKVIRLLPPLIITAEQIDVAVNTITQTLCLLDNSV